MERWLFSISGSVPDRYEQGKEPYLAVTRWQVEHILETVMNGFFKFCSSVVSEEKSTVGNCFIYSA